MNYTQLTNFVNTFLVQNAEEQMAPGHLLFCVLIIIPVFIFIYYSECFS